MFTPFPPVFPIVNSNLIHLHDLDFTFKKKKEKFSTFYTQKIKIKELFLEEKIVNYSVFPFILSNIINFRQKMSAMSERKLIC